MTRTFTYIARAEDLPATLGGFLRRRGYSASLLAALRQQGGVWVDGAFRRMIHSLLAGETVSVTLPPEQAGLCPNTQLKLPILYADQDILVLDKPANMLVHPAGLGFDDAVGNFAAACWPDQVFRPIGRLDRNTTGALLVARHQLAAGLLTRGPVAKTYYAVAQGELAKDRGRIDLPLLRQEGPVITYVPHPLGKACSTLYQVLAKGHGLTLLCLKLLTGRTHQIRAHLAGLGHPLAGDRLYGGSQALISRQALHCGEICFHSLDRATRRVQAPWPPDLLALLESFDLSPAGLAGLGPGWPGSALPEKGA